MSLVNLIKKGSLRSLATATPATPATVSPNIPQSVATVATVNVAKAPDRAANDPSPEPPDDPQGWHALDAAYLAHHFACPMCIAAGRGSRYGQRCGVGQALWRSYLET